MIFFTKAGDVTHSCSVSMEPVSRRQKLLPDYVKVSLTGVLKDWDSSSLMQTSTEAWVLYGTRNGDQGAAAFQHLLMDLSTYALHMVRHPNTMFLFYTIYAVLLNFHLPCRFRLCTDETINSKGQIFCQ